MREIFVIECYRLKANSNTLSKKRVPLETFGIKRSDIGQKIQAHNKVQLISIYSKLKC